MTNFEAPEICLERERERESLRERREANTTMAEVKLLLKALAVETVEEEGSVTNWGRTVSQYAKIAVTVKFAVS